MFTRGTGVLTDSHMSHMIRFHTTPSRISDPTIPQRGEGGEPFQEKLEQQVEKFNKKRDQALCSPKLLALELQNMHILVLNSRSNFSTESR